MTIKTSRKDRVIYDLKRIFRRNPNGLFAARYFRTNMSEYNEGDIYNGLKTLTNENYINRSMLRHQSYYWRRRKE